MRPEIDVRRGCTSASNAEADSKCAARHLAQRGIPQPARSKDSEFGSRIHFALSAENTTAPQSLSLPEREVFDACREIEKKLVLSFFDEGERMTVTRERSDGSTRLWARVPDGKGGFFEHSAQPDVIYLANHRALIVEYKTLAGDVPSAPENLQLRDQAVLFRGNNTGVTVIGTAVVQPLVTHSPTICEYDTAALDRSEAEMFARVRASNNPQSPRTAGKPQCDFCLAKTNCIAFQQWAGSTVPGMLSILDVPAASWTPEQCAVFLTNEKVAEKWLAACHADIFNRMSNGENIPGFMLKEGNKKETIVDPQKVFDRFTAIGGKLEQFMQCIAVGKTKLKEKVAKVSGAKGKALDSAMNTLLDEAIEVSQNKPSIVPNDAP